MSDESKRRPLLRWAAFFIVCSAIVWGGKQALLHPDTPLPRHWNPVAELLVDDPVTLVTNWKLTRTVADPQLCLDALSAARTAFEVLPDKIESEQCYIRNRVRLTSVGNAQINGLETNCPVALRLALWEHHGLQPAAHLHLQTDIARIHHIGSYNCRAIRTPSGSSGRMSTHATADAVDIVGVTLSDGRRLRLKRDWEGATSASAFLRSAHQSSCTWFKTSLGPEFNALHADHFHLQNIGWGTCR